MVYLVKIRCGKLRQRFCGGGIGQVDDTIRNSPFFDSGCYPPINFVCVKGIEICGFDMAQFRLLSDPRSRSAW